MVGSMAHAVAASAATGMDCCAGHVPPLASLLLSFTLTPSLIKSHPQVHVLIH